MTLKYKVPSLQERERPCAEGTYCFGQELFSLHKFSVSILIFRHSGRLTGFPGVLCHEYVIGSLVGYTDKNTMGGTSDRGCTIERDEGDTG